MISNFRWIPKFLFCKVPISVESQNVRERLLKFPYSFLNQRIISRAFISDTSDFLHQNFSTEAIAFASLTEKHPNVLRSYYQKLFNQEYKSDKQLTGQVIFGKYFMPNLAFIKNSIKNSTNQQEIVYNLKKLFFLKDSPIEGSQLIDVELKNIQNSEALSHKAYLVNIYQGSPKFLAYLQHFFSEFKKAKKQDQIQAAFVLLSIPQFYLKLPSNLCQYSIDLITQNLQKMDDWEIYRTISFIFLTDFSATRRFADAVMKNMLKQINQDNIQAKVPLFLKVIKLRDKLKMGSSQLQKYINENPLRFMSIFLKKKINKQPFLDVVATKDPRRYLPEQIKIRFIDYVFKIYNDAIHEEQCDSEELIETTKLTLKFYHNFNSQKIEALVAMFEDHLIPMFQEDNQISFWLTTLLLRMDGKKIKKPQILRGLKKLQKQYHQQYLKSSQFMQKHKNLQKVVQIYYHFVRASVPIDKPSTIKQYDYKHVTTFQQVIYACFVVTKIQLPASDKLQILQRMVPKIAELLDKGRFRNIKNIFLILTFVQSANCPQMDTSKPVNFLLSKIQTAYINLLAKQNQCPPSYSLNFIKKVYRGNRMQNNQKETKIHENKTQRYQFQKFIAFINSCLKNPNEFKINYEEYRQNVKPKSTNKIHHQNKFERKRK